MVVNGFFIQVSVVLELEASPVDITEIPCAVILDTKDIVAERLHNASRSVPTKAQLFTFKKVFFSDQYIVTSREVGRFVFASGWMYARALLLSVLKNKRVKLFHHRDQLKKVENWLQLSLGESDGMAVEAAEKRCGRADAGRPVNAVTGATFLHWGDGALFKV